MYLCTHVWRRLQEKICDSELPVIQLYYVGTLYICTPRENILINIPIIIIIIIVMRIILSCRSRPGHERCTLVVVVTIADFQKGDLNASHYYYNNNIRLRCSTYYYNICVYNVLKTRCLTLPGCPSKLLLPLRIIIIIRPLSDTHHTSVSS